jgi:putative membrane protein
MMHAHRWSLVAAAVTLAACSTKKDASVSDSAAGAVTPSTATTTPATTPGATPATASAPAMTDANIIAMEHGGDSAEVVIATYAQTHAANAEVKAYARQLVTDHGKGDREVQALATKLSITPQPPSGDTTSQETEHTLAHLGTLKGFDFDTAFVQHEIADHKVDIEDAHKASAAAQSPEVKALVDKSLPELQKHLDRAQALEKKLAAGKKS